MSVIEPRYKGTEEYWKSYGLLEECGKEKKLLYYEKFSPILGIPVKGHHFAYEVGYLLGEICEAEMEAGRPMLSALVVSKTDGHPTIGFHKMATDLGKYDGSLDENGNLPEQLAFWAEELAAVFKRWKGKL